MKHAAIARKALPEERTNYVVECPCGYLSYLATLDGSFALQRAADHIRAQERTVEDIFGGLS